MRQIAVNIRAARIDRGLTQESLARALGVGVRVVQGWESDGDGQHIPRTSNLRKLADVLERDPSWFYADHTPLAA